MLTALAIASGLLQAAGYTIYIRKALAKEIDPNPATWLMFAYGTATLVVLEWDRDASAMLLVLPVVCALLSVYVAYLSWQKIGFSWSRFSLLQPLDRISMATDIALTIGYVGIWLATANGWLSEENRLAVVLLFLVLSNLSTVVQFVPLMQGAWRKSGAEHYLPWSVWSSAYLMLALLTYLEEREFNELILYPLSGVILHGAVAVLAARNPPNRTLSTLC